MDYNYLKNFISKNEEKLNKSYIFNESSQPNWFNIVTAEEIKKAEEKTGFNFPIFLKVFWEEVGYGFFESSYNGLTNINYDTVDINRLCSPEQISDILLGSDNEENNFLLGSFIEFEEDEIPFFQINSGDCAEFLLIKPNSDKPEAVYRGNLLIEESFEKFIWRLYYESPTFYLDVPDPEHEKWLIEKEIEEKEEQKRLRNAPTKGVLWEYISRNYYKQLWKDGASQNLKYGGEVAAEKMLETHKDLIKLNHCPNCGNLKKTPQARQCLKCGQFHESS